MAGFEEFRGGGGGIFFGSNLAGFTLRSDLAGYRSDTGRIRGSRKDERFDFLGFAWISLDLNLGVFIGRIY
jgi:hypothetical protein